MIVPFKSSEIEEKFYSIFGEDSERAVLEIVKLAETYAKCTSKDSNYRIEIQEVYGENGKKVGAVELRIGEKEIMLPWSTLEPYQTNIKGKK